MLPSRGRCFAPTLNRHRSTLNSQPANLRTDTLVARSPLWPHPALRASLSIPRVRALTAGWALGRCRDPAPRLSGTEDCEKGLSPVSNPGPLVRLTGTVSAHDR